MRESELNDSVRVIRIAFVSLVAGMAWQVSFMRVLGEQAALTLLAVIGVIWIAFNMITRIVFGVR